MAVKFLAALLWSVASGDHPPPVVSRVRYSSVTERLEHGVSLSTSTHSIFGDRPELITVRWQGLRPELQGDSWVGLYLSGESAAEVVPMKYQFCNHTNLQSYGRPAGRKNLTEGALAFELLNYRADAIFQLFSGWDRPVLVATSEPVRIIQPASPSGVHLALTGASGEVAITWTGPGHAARAMEDRPRAEFQVLRNGKLLRRGVAEASAPTTYTRSELCGAPATAEGYRDPGFFYTVRVGELEPGCIVRYRVGSSEAWSKEFSFRAPPAAGAAVRILAFGDMGQQPPDDSLQASGDDWHDGFFSAGDPGAPNTTQALLRDHLEQPADMILHNGDLSYAMGYSAEWENFQHAIEPLASAVPWMVTIGNHERDWPNSGSTEGDTDSLGECGVPTLRRFPGMPFESHEPQPKDKPWYALELGVVYLLALSTEHDLMPGSPQHAFLVAALSKVDRSRTPWVLLAGHRPYHVSSNWEGDADFPARFRSAVGDLIEGQVDLILGAHHHSYQRTCALQGDQCAQTTGPVVVNLGTGGANLNHVNKTLPPLFEVADDKHFGYCRISADAEKLSLEFVRSDGSGVHDRLALHKSTDRLRSTLDELVV